MGTSIGGISSASASTSVEPMSYAVDNQSVTSTAFTDALKAMQGVGGISSVGPTNPVRYANAVVKTNSDKMQDSIDTNSAYNDIASSFKNNTIGYDNGSQALSFQMLGTGIDTFA